MKDDNAVNVEWLNQLPFDEFVKEFPKLTNQQKEVFFSTSYKGHTKPIVVDYSLEELLKNGAVLADEYLKNW